MMKCVAAMDNVEGIIHVPPITFEAPDYGWECKLFGCEEGIVLWRFEGEQPNAFWRLMQYLLIGNKWRRLNNRKYGDG